MGNEIAVLSGLEIVRKRCWVGWLFGEKEKYIPITPNTGKAAKSNDPDTWGSYEEAVDALQHNHYLQGLGVMFDAERDGIFGVDLDHVIDPDTGEVDPRALDVVGMLDSYAEISPSGTGIHILCKGRFRAKEGVGLKKGWIEVYEKGRFFRVTGNPFGELKPISEASEALNEVLMKYDLISTPKPPGSFTPSSTLLNLDDEQIVSMARRSKNGDSFSVLFQGNIAGYLSASEADLALCNYLAFWTGRNAEQMDRIFRSSGLYRAKWDERHGEKTYGQMTIEKAASECPEVYSGRMCCEAKEKLMDVFEPFTAAYRGLNGYSSDHGSTYKVKVREDGSSEQKKLAHFTARPVEQIIRDDGIEHRQEIVMDGITSEGKMLQRLSIPMNRFNAMNWPVDSWGMDGNIAPGVGNKEYLRHAIQTVGSTTPKRIIFTHTGWRKIGSRWTFLHSDGAIGQSNVSVELDSILDAYRFPSETGDLQSAIAAEKDFLSLMPLHVAVPLMATAYLAPLCEFLQIGGYPPAFALYLLGRSGTRKSTAAALMLSHFGSRFHAKSLPASFHDTTNMLRYKAFLLKDVPMVVDDFHPTMNRKERQRMDDMAQQLSRTWGDRAERGRLRADATAGAVQPPRGIGVITGEELPSIGESGIGRFYIVEMKDGDIPLGDHRLSSLQDKAENGDLSRAMRGYIEWLIPQADELPKRLVQMFKTYREEARNAVSEIHARIPEAVASLMLGYHMALTFWLENEAITADEYQVMWNEGVYALLQNADYQEVSMKEEDPIDMFLQTTKELLATGKVYIAGEGGNDPLQGNPIGYRKGNVIYLLPMVAYNAVNNQSQSAGNAFPWSRNTLWKRMHENGMLDIPPDGILNNAFVPSSFGVKKARAIPLYAQYLAEDKEKAPEAE